MPNNKISPNLKQAWSKFSDLTRKRLGMLGNLRSQEGRLLLIRNRNVEIREILSSLEESVEFDCLANELRLTNIPEGYRHYHSSLWQLGIRNFLKRSGFYLENANRNSRRPEVTLENLIEALNKNSQSITYLAPMEFINLQRNEISCSTFKIRRFAQSDLDDLLGRQLNEVFYPASVFDTGFLSNYWFLVLTETKPIQPIFLSKVPHFGKVTLSYSPYPALEKALRRLVFYDWLPDLSKGRELGVSDWSGWKGFNLPFVIKITDNFLQAPMRAPESSILLTKPYFDPNTNEDLGEEPEIYNYLDEKETEALAQTISKVDELLLSFEAAEGNWPFVSRSLNFFTKAFFTEGLEQLLWHITALEALLGETRGGITEKLADRVGIMLGGSAQEQRELKKRFREIYDFRSKLVHGAEFKNQIWEGHLLQARDFARRILFWFLNFLANTLSILGNSNPVILPKRQDILSAIDLGPGAITSLSKVVNSLPQEFPNISSWAQTPSGDLNHRT